LALARNGKLDEAVEKGRRAVEMGPNPWDRHALAQILLYRGAFAEAEALVKPVVADQSRTKRERAYAARSYSAALAMQGRRREALQALDVMRDWPNFASQYHEFRLMHFVGDGATLEARAELELALRTLREDPAEARHLLALAAWAGSPERCAELARSIKLESPQDLFMHGLLAWHAGRLDAAASAFQTLTDRKDVYRYVALFFLGDVEAARGRHAEALAAVEKFRGTFLGGWHWLSWAWPRSQIIEARALDALGRRVEAKEKVRVFLEAWRDADPDLPLLAEAKALQERLAAGATVK
jgi:hypothetical protein